MVSKISLIYNTRKSISIEFKFIPCRKFVSVAKEKDNDEWKITLKKAEKHIDFQMKMSGFLVSNTQFGRSEIDYFASLSKRLRSIVGSSHPFINTINSYYLQSGGKHIRPLLVLLLGKVLNAPEEKLSRLAELTELIHTASLLHDDVIDRAHSRRLYLSAPILFGNKASILSGDYLLASASLELAKLGELRVVELMSESLCDLIRGELMQMDVPPSQRFSLDYYLEKSFRKTAALIAKSCQSAAFFARSEFENTAFLFGKYFGMAFQVVDDKLDFELSDEQSLKTVGLDLENGIVTAPAIFASQEEPGLKILYDREFSQEGDISKALDIIRSSNALEKTNTLIQELGDKALEELAILPDVPETDILKEIVRSLQHRTI